MSLAVAIQMDPIESINIDADSTFMMALEGQAPGTCAVSLPPPASQLPERSPVRTRTPVGSPPAVRQSLHPGH